MSYLSFTMTFLSTPISQKYRIFYGIKDNNVKVSFWEGSKIGMIDDTMISFVCAGDIWKDYTCIMVDASLIKNTSNSFRVGLVVVNEDLKVLNFTSKDIGICKDNIEAELEAIIEGLEWANRRGDRKIVIESDCQSIIDKLNLKSFPNIAVHRFIYCWRHLNSFEDHHIKYVPRECNRAANFVAGLPPPPAPP